MKGCVCKFFFAIRGELQFQLIALPLLALACFMNRICTEMS